MSNSPFSTQETQAALEFTRHIIEKHGPRITGNQSTLNAANDIFTEFESYCDKTIQETFTVHPKAFLGWIRLLVSLYLISVGFLWTNLPLISALLITVGILVMVFQFFLYKTIIDPFWKAGVGKNVVGIIEPEKEVKQQILISGHHDSAFVFNFLVHQPQLYALRIYGGLGSVVLLWLASWIWTIVQWITQSNPRVMLVVQILATVSLLLVLQLWFFRGNHGTPGAGDNMIAVGIVNEIGKKIATLKKEGKGLQHTRIYVCSWDAEEAGLRGARNYVKSHKVELLAVPTYNFNIDCPYYASEIFFLTSDINGSVQMSTKMADECVSIAKSLGYPSSTKPIAFLTGGTDAGELAKIGVEATTLFGMPWGNSQRASVYHTPQDTVENIEPEAVERSLNIIWKYIYQKEKEISAPQ